jgi:hypothetical protein
MRDTLPWNSSNIPEEIQLVLAFDSDAWLQFLTLMSHALTKKTTVRIRHARSAAGNDFFAHLHFNVAHVTASGLFL